VGEKKTEVEVILDITGKLREMSKEEQFVEYADEYGYDLQVFARTIEDMTNACVSVSELKREIEYLINWGKFQQATNEIYRHTTDSLNDLWIEKLEKSLKELGLSETAFFRKRQVAKKPRKWNNGM